MPEELDTADGMPKELDTAEMMSEELLDTADRVLEELYT